MVVGRYAARWFRLLAEQAYDAVRRQTMRGIARLA